jgi:opacity protein-like surface antigen
MTKTSLAAVLALAVLCALPAAAAHGAPPVRGIDVRVLLDQDGTLGYGGGGLDVLALDVREASFPDGAPAVVFRLVMQSEAPPAGQSLALTFTAGGKSHTLTAGTDDGAVFASPDFDRVDGPFDVGDGHPKAIDGWMRAATLGVKPGDKLTGFSVGSLDGDGAMDDVMPGGWFMQGQEIPPVEVPGVEEEAEGAAGDYMLHGPAELLKLEATPAQADAPANVTLRLTDQSSLPQFVGLTLVAPAGIKARLEQSAVSLDGNGARVVDVVVSSATSDGVVQVIATSDLGAYSVLQLVVGASSAPTTNVTADADAADPADHDGASKDSPTPILALPALALALLVLRRLR